MSARSDDGIFPIKIPEADAALISYLDRHHIIWERSRRTVTPPREKSCEFCGESFTAKRSDARYCGATCRQAAHREGQ